MKANRQTRGTDQARVRWPRVGRYEVVTAVSLLLALGGTTPTSENTALATPRVSWVLLALVTGLVVHSRSQAPRATVALTAAGCALYPLLGLSLNPLLAAPALTAIYHLALSSDRRTSGTAAGACALLFVGASLTAGPDNRDVARALGMLGFVLLAGAIGDATRTRRAYLAAVEERAERAERDRESEARRRVGEERLRIARELHDIVAHHIALANAQASAAATLFDRRPDRARTALHQLTETTSTALDELRATVGLLRQPSEPGSPADPGTVAPLEPAPGLAQLPSLVESFQRAGLTATVREEGNAQHLSSGVDLAAYRIIQEALTNVTKHASVRAARVALCHEKDQLRITIDNDASPATPAEAPVPDRSSGYGLIGARERASAVGGDLHAGRRADGGFRVSATLPIISATRTPNVTYPPATELEAAS